MARPLNVTDYMAKECITFRPDQNVLEAIQTLLTNRISGAPVVDDENRIVGILSEKDCLPVILEASYHNDPGKLVRDLMSTNVTTVDAEASLMDVAEKFIATSFRRFPVVSKGKLVGQISRRDVLRAIETLRG
ncbi:MAG: CBS domain-containing protein [Candidatus Neomarinimicrobiota bacterium]|nr:MAG: CBS domain-containing protein [Candidatus Neomarinimicrobiota bacterium]